MSVINGNTDIIINSSNVNTSTKNDSITSNIKEQIDKSINNICNEYFNNINFIHKLKIKYYIYRCYKNFINLNDNINNNTDEFKQNIESHFSNNLHIINYLKSDINLFCMICIFMHLTYIKFYDQSIFNLYVKKNKFTNTSNYILLLNENGFTIKYKLLSIVYKYNLYNTNIYYNNLSIVLYHNLCRIELYDNNNTQYYIYDCNEKDITKCFTLCDNISKVQNKENINHIPRLSRSINRKNIRSSENSRSRSPIRKTSKSPKRKYIKDDINDDICVNININTPIFNISNINVKLNINNH